MTHNPIYDGPVYDSIQPQFDTLTPTKSDMDESIIDLSEPPSDQPSRCRPSISSESRDDEHSQAKDPRYVKQQSPHATDHFRSKSFSSGQLPTPVPYVMPISSRSEINGDGGRVLQRSASVAAGPNNGKSADMSIAGRRAQKRKLQLTIPPVSRSTNQDRTTGGNHGTTSHHTLVLYTGSMASSLGALH